MNHLFRAVKHPEIKLTSATFDTVDTLIWYVQSVFIQDVLTEKKQLFTGYSRFSDNLYSVSNNEDLHYR